MQIMDSGASFHMMSERELFSVEENTIRKSEEPNVITTANLMAESAEEATVNVNDLIGSAFWVCCAKKWATLVSGWRKGESPSLRKGGTL